MIPHTYTIRTWEVRFGYQSLLSEREAPTKDLTRDWHAHGSCFIPGSGFQGTLDNWEVGMSLREFISIVYEDS